MQFIVRSDDVVIRRADPLDPVMLALTSEVFGDWDSPEADEAFKHL